MPQCIINTKYPFIKLSQETLQNNKYHNISYILKITEYKNDHTVKTVVLFRKLVRRGTPENRNGPVHRV